METIYETYTRQLCSNCKNKKCCEEELRRKINNTIKCDKYIKDKDIEGYKKRRKHNSKTTEADYENVRNI